MEQIEKVIPKTWIVLLDKHKTVPYSTELNFRVGIKFKHEDGFIYEIVSDSFNKFFGVKFLYAKKFYGTE